MTGDDQYNNESVRSTRTVINLEKSVENSSRNKKIGQQELCAVEIKKNIRWRRIDNNRC